jgi:hypothetical protein
VKRHVNFSVVKRHCVLSIPLSSGTLVAPLEVFVDDLGRDILQFLSNPGLKSLRLQVVLQPIIEGFMMR